MLEPLMRMGVRLVLISCCTLLFTCGCSSTGPRTIAAINATGQDIRDVPLIIFYWAEKYGTYGGHLTKTLVHRCDVQFYVGQSPLKINPPRHVGFDPLVLPGTYWSGTVRVIAQGYELEFVANDSSTVEQSVYRLMRLDEKTIALQSIRKIAWLKREMDAFDVTEGVDPSVRRKFCELVLDFYGTWQRRWGNPAVRERYYRSQDPNQYNSVSTSTETRIREAEVVVAKMKKCLPQE